MTIPAYKQHQTKHLLYVLTGCDMSMKFARAPNHQIPQLVCPCVCCTGLPTTVVELHPYDSPSQ